MKTSKLALISAALLTLSASSALAEPWQVDASHSSVGFSVRHMMISNVRGAFATFGGTVEIDDKALTKSTVSFEVDVASVDTRDKKRDDHLRSPEFFDAAAHPKMTFVSTSIKKAGKAYKVLGNLTMHGVTKPVTLAVTLTKPIATPFGTTVRGATVSGTINRKDFGVSWNKTMDAGGLAVGEDVEIQIELELQKKS